MVIRVLLSAAAIILAATIVWWKVSVAIRDAGEIESLEGKTWEDYDS